MKKVAIVGYGYVGQAMHKIFPDAVIYDEFKGIGVRDEVNDCGMAIICVPTPPKGMKEQKVNVDESVFREVDLAALHYVYSWLKTPLAVIKSTIPPGTTDIVNKMCPNVMTCFSPEFVGESHYHVPARYPDPTDPRQHDFLIMGGKETVVDKVLEYWIDRLGPAKTYYRCTAREAECIKYMENTWGAMKVTFANEWYEMCKAFGASYIAVREGWALDSRVEKMHTAVFTDKRGFSGKCFPKDLLGIVAQSEKNGYDPKLLKEVWKSNKRFLALNDTEA